MVDMKKEECFLCLRIPQNQVYRLTKKLWRDRKIAWRIALKALTLIKTAYFKSINERREHPIIHSRLSIIGKSAKAIVCGAVYLACRLIEGELPTTLWRGQADIVTAWNDLMITSVKCGKYYVYDRKCIKCKQCITDITIRNTAFILRELLGINLEHRPHYKGSYRRK